jgi:hypothetical protein
MDYLHEEYADDRFENAMNNILSLDGKIKHRGC